MADFELRSPQAKVSKREQYIIHLGYGEAGKELWNDFKEIETRMGFSSFQETARWVFTAVKPLVEADEKEMAKHMVVRPKRTSKGQTGTIQPSSSSEISRR